MYHFVLLMIFYVTANAVFSVNSSELFPDFTQEFLDGPKIPPDTIDSINLKAYVGRWYQMCASIAPNKTFEKDGYCVTADYFNVPTKGIAFGLTNSMR